MNWWNVLESSITCESGWRFRLNSALPWPGGGNEFTWHNRNIKKCREDLGKLYVHFNFLSPFRRLFVLSVTSLFYESDHEWEDQPGWGDEETQKTMRNKCPEQTLQVRIQYCIQLRSSLATMMLNVLQTAFSLFPVITIAVTYRCMLQCLGEQCIKWWKATKLKLCGQRKRSLHHRSSPSDSPASDQGKHQGYLTGCSTTWVWKKQSEWTSGRGIYGKILNRLNEISYEVQMTLLKLYLLENRQ